MLQLASECALRDVERTQFVPVTQRTDSALHDSGNSAALDVGVIADATPVFDAVQPIRHRFHEIEVVAFTEGSRFFSEAERLEIDAGQMSPEAVWRTVHGLGAERGFDAAQFVQRRKARESLVS